MTELQKELGWEPSLQFEEGIEETVKWYLFSKTYPSFLTVKEGSTSHLGLLPSGKKRETALLGARNRYAIRLAGHQSPAPCLCGLGPPGVGGDSERQDVPGLPSFLGYAR